MARQIGPFKEDPDYLWRDSEAQAVQNVYDHCTWDWSLVGDDIYIRFVTHVTGAKYASGWGYEHTGGTGRLHYMEVANWLIQHKQEYTIVHELAHFMDADKLNGNQHTYPIPGSRGQLHPYFNKGFAHPWAYASASSDSECYAHQFTKLYADSYGITNWNWLTSTYPRKFAPADYSVIRNIIETSTKDGGPVDPPGIGDDAIEYVAEKDLPRRKNKATGAWQADGLHHHLLTGYVPIDGSSPDYIYDFLIQFDINEWPEAARVNNAYLELVLVSGDADSIISGPGADSVLKAQLVTESWSEGNNASGTWDNSDYENPTVQSNSVVIGTVGHPENFFGTVIQFDVLSLVRQWGPTSLAFGSLGAGQNKPNHGLLIKATKTGGISGAAEFASQQYQSPHTDWRPMLRLEFTPTAVNPVAFADRPNVTANSNIFDFEGVYVDPLGEDVIGAKRIEVRKAGGDYVWQPDWMASGSNEKALGTFSIPSSGAPQSIATWMAGQAYEWRAKVRSAASSKESGWTPWTGFTVTNLAPSISATLLGTKATLDHVYFGGPFSDPDSPAALLSPETIAGTGPLGFPKMSLWLNFWAWMDDNDVQDLIDALQYMHMTGVVAKGCEFSNANALPSGIVAKLDMFIAAGITPYVGLWMGQFDSAERTSALARWNDGAGRWAGAVIDAESGWVNNYSAHPGTSTTNLTTFVNQLRSAGCSMVGYTSYSRPDFWDSGDHDYGWDVWDDLCDLAFPQTYFRPDGIDDDTPANGEKIIDHTLADFDRHGLTTPIIPLVNASGANANAQTRAVWADHAIATCGAASVWHYKIDNSEVRDVFHNIDIGTPPPPPFASSVVSTRLQLRTESEGNPAWNGTTGFLWDTSEQPLTTEEVENQQIRRLYSGAALPAGSYTYRVAVMDTAGAWSDWDYAPLTLTVGYQPDPGAYDYLSGYNAQRYKSRIVIMAEGTNRGPGSVVAVLYDASNVGASMLVNDSGEFYFTVPTTHPQVAEIEPMQRHYSWQFWRNGQWKPVFEGLITDMDATEDDVVFYGIDYLGLLGKSVETAFFNKDDEDKSIDEGGAKYIDQQLSYVIKDQLARAKDATLSPDSLVGFINVEAQNQHTLMESIASKVSINAAFKERLTFIQGLIQSARQGNGSQHRLWPERIGDGSYRWRYQTAAGTERENLRLRYGELVQGFRIVVLGTSWGSRVYGVGRKAVSANLYFKKADAPGIDTAIWGNVAVPALWQDLSDENDLQRRVNQMAREVGKFGKSVALGLRVSGLAVLDGYDLCDNVPVEIVRGAVNTNRYGSGYWTIHGVEYRTFPDGHDELTLAIKPREDTTPPNPDLIPSKPISDAEEWFRSGLIGVHLAAVSSVVVRDDGTIAAQMDVSWDAVDETGFAYYVIQIARDDATGVFTNALTLSADNNTATIDDLLPGEGYNVRIGAYDTDGGFSGWSPSVTATAAVDTTPPPVPTGLLVQGVIKGLVVAFQPVGAADLDHYEVAYRLHGTTDFAVISTHSSLISVTGLAQNQPSIGPTLTYDVKVRAVDTSTNASAYTAIVIGTPVLAGGGDVEFDSITTEHITTDGLDASVITTGTLTIGGLGVPPTLVVYNAAGVEIGRVDSNGMLWKDPSNTARQMRFLDGVLEFSKDGGATWTTAINADGVIANAVLLGGLPGGHNLLPNSSFEMVDFVAEGTKLWTLTTDWDDLLAGGVFVDYSTGDLKLTSVTY